MSEHRTSNHSFEITAKFDRRLAWARGGSVRYLVVEVKTSEPDPSRRIEPPKSLNLALVIDVSGSMGGRKLPAAKSAVSGVIDGLGIDDRLNVVSFASDTVVNLSDTRMDDEGREQANAIIRRLASCGQTNLSSGWLKGAECIAERMENTPGGQVLNRLVVLSDGQANLGITAPLELQCHAARLRTLGIMTSAVGIGDDYDATLLQLLAEHGGGRMHDAEHVEEIGEVLLGELRDSRAAAVDNLTIKMMAPINVRCTPLGGLPVEHDGETSCVVLGSIPPRTVRKVVFKVQCPAGKTDEEIPFTLIANGQVPGREGPESLGPFTMSLAFAEGSRNTDQPRDINIATDVSVAWHAHVVRVVARMNRSRERREARAYLDRELNWFERYCRDIPDAEPLISELARMQRHIDRDWDERTRKEMELSSYKTSRSDRDHRSSARRHWSERLED